MQWTNVKSDSRSFMAVILSELGISLEIPMSYSDIESRMSLFEALSFTYGELHVVGTMRSLMEAEGTPVVGTITGKNADHVMVNLIARVAREAMNL